MKNSVRMEKAKAKAAGFTFIEVMVVISCITALSALALPSYLNQMVRDKVHEALSEAKVAMVAVEEHYRREGVFPQDNAMTGLPAPEEVAGDYVTSVSVDRGVVTVTLGNGINDQAGGKTVVIRPAVTPDEPKAPIAWVYGHASVPEGMAVVGVDNGTLPAKYLPVYARKEK